MLTALSVARECGMVGENQKIILVQAFPGTTGKNDPWLEYMYTEDPQDHHQKSTVRKSLSLFLSHHIISCHYFHDLIWKFIESEMLSFSHRKRQKLPCLTAQILTITLLWMEGHGLS